MELRSPFFVSIIAAALFAGCSSSTDPAQVDPSDIGSNTEIELTKPGNTWSATLRLNGEAFSAPISVVSEKRENGITTIRFTIDLTGHPDSATIAGIVPSEYKDAQGRISSSIRMKFTTEGIQDYSQEDKPWTIVKYDAKVGDTYTVTDPNGLVKKRTVVERTNLDDWSFGWFLIKTIKVEENLPAGDDVASKIWYRANHRFGLVYMETFLKAGGSIRVDLVTMANV